MSVQFANQSSGNISTYQWDFGDGSSSNELNPLHTYATDGTYNVSLNILGTDGSTDSHSEQVAVSAPAQANFTSSVDGLNVQFTNQSSGNIVLYAWDFGDTATSNEQSPLHTYATGGTYTVTLTVTGSDSSTASHTEQVTVAMPLHADFTTTVDGLNAQFTNQSTGDIALYSWDFGDGATTNEQSPLHTYAAGSTYTVTLIVTNTTGQTDARSLDVTVAATVQANFTFSATDLTVQFTDTSSGTITQYTWDFGDGNISNEQNPLYTYAAQGTYNVTLSVIDTSGASAKFSADVTVNAPPT